MVLHIKISLFSLIICTLDLKLLKEILQCKSPEVKEFINLPDNEHHANKTPLLLAISKGYNLVVDELVRAGANLSAFSITGWT
jgi:hypothetical protein